MPKARKSSPKKRRQDCIKCGKIIHGCYGAHETICRKKPGDWLGWKYFLMDGKTVVDECVLPIRHFRGKAVNANKNEFKEPDPKIIGWRRLKQSKWTCRRDLRKAGLQYVIERLLEHGMEESDLNQAVEDAIDDDEFREIRENK